MCRLLFVFIICIVILMNSCSSEDGYVYKGKQPGISGVLIDSTFYFICGDDSMYYYQLHRRTSLKFNDTVSVGLYGVSYKGSVGRFTGYGIKCNLEFQISEEEGGLPSALKWGDDNFDFGGYIFYRTTDDSAKIIFHKWIDLMSNNRDAKIKKKVSK